MANAKTLTPDFDYDSVKQAIGEIAKEGDRAAVILAAAKFDLLLEQALKQLLLPPPSGTDELFDGDAPLSTFSSKINLAYRVGLIDAQFAHALHLVRRIRNAFAHELSNSSLTAGVHRDRVRELVGPLRPFKILDTFVALNSTTEREPGTMFRAAVGIMITRLEESYRTKRSLRDLEPMSLVFPGWKHRAERKARHAQIRATSPRKPKPSKRNAPTD